MSLGPTWALCNDGLFYKEPVWRDSDNEYFLCFDEDEPPELIVKKPKSLTCVRAKEIAEEILLELGIKGTVREGSYFGGAFRSFAKKGFKFYKAFCFYIDITEPPPPPNEFRGTPTSDRSKLDGTFYHFGKDLQRVVPSNPTRRK